MDTSELERKLSRARDWSNLIKGWRVERGADAAGNDALWVWVTLEKALDHRELRAEIRRRVREALAGDVDPDSGWVYVRFRDPTEEQPEAV